MLSKYKEAIENSNIVSKTDKDGIITFVNDEFCSIHGYTKNELIGKTHKIVKHPDVASDDFEEMWDTIKVHKKTYIATVKNFTKDGKTVYLNTTIIPILNDNNDIEEFVAIRYNITKRVELRQELEKKDKELEALNETLEQRVQEQTRQLKELNRTLEKRVEEEIKKNIEKQKILLWQSRMASLGQMIASIAHQWRQPLTELKLTLYNINRVIQKNPENQQILEYYSDGKFIIDGMSKTIDDFSNFFAPNKISEPFYIHSSVNETLKILDKLLAREKIFVKTSLKKIKVTGISNELSQVLINLIQNANDAFKQHNLKQKTISIKAYKNDDNEAVIEIKDNALGINENDIDKIFEPYFTTKHSSQGTGLGLFMSKMIVKQSLNGSINAKNYDNGAIITIKIPISL